MSRTSTREIVIRLDGKLDGVLATQKDQSQRSSDHERRIRSLERYLWMGLGILAIAGALMDYYLATR